ncbi:MAG: glycine C-acetyltransferase, partial [Frankiaceae bacterium]|nr:glycine C-acetyltransferase [Frankiaceae bacterium]
MYATMRTELTGRLEEMRGAGLYKHERVLRSPQGPDVLLGEGGEQRHVLNFCANNYLGLADHPAVLAAARDALERWGYGMASVRFICGT